MKPHRALWMAVKSSGGPEGRDTIPYDSCQGAFLSMDESKPKRRAHAAVLDGCPWCIYCGGDTPATTVDHVPPIIMFAQRRRPKGLEFGSCEPCNGGTKHADLVAAMIGRSMPDSKMDADREEMKGIFSAVEITFPDFCRNCTCHASSNRLQDGRKKMAGCLVPMGRWFRLTCKPLRLRSGFPSTTN